MRNNKIFFIDTETNSLDFRKGKIKLIVFSKDFSEIITTTSIDENLKKILKDRSTPIL